jgi:predicted nucleic acid-binding protein
VKYLLDVSELVAWCQSSSRTTDAHLLELAETHGAKFATLDTGIPGVFLIPSPTAKSR